MPRTHLVHVMPVDIEDDAMPVRSVDGVLTCPGSSHTSGPCQHHQQQQAQRARCAVHNKGTSTSFHFGSSG